MTRRVLQIYEWGSLRTDLTAPEKAALQARAQSWQLQNNHVAPPFWFEGAQGEWLKARNYVGVLEAGEIALEIRPKLDAANEGEQSAVGNFLWLLEAAQSVNEEPIISFVDPARLRNAPLDFFDVIAFLFARRLLPELEDGLPLNYQSHSGDLPLVRGRVNFARQLTRHWDRRDKTACVWDELNADTTLARVLKGACRLLRRRVRHPRTAALLEECLALLTDVEDSSPGSLLREEINFNRHTERFSFCVALARRLLENAAYQMAAGETPGLSFLLDMNAVFEDYVRAALQAHFRAPVSAQHEVGALLQLPRPTIAQRADFRWFAKERNELWLGDAKYKNNSGLPDADDVRQITVYGEMERRKLKSGASQNPLPHLALLYPFAGGEFKAQISRAWNDASLYFVPVHLRPPGYDLRAALPAEF
jgi:5-methylcytosine-specific restriction endonuclease McrBC regulatory subunit McrC